jgi:basic membrane protein A and related proteins
MMFLSITPKQTSRNVYSVTYKQNEGSYLAGVYVGLMSQTGVVGVVGGQDIPVINDFIVGYEQGARENGVTNVIVQYAGGWNDPAKGKELALAMFQQGCGLCLPGGWWYRRWCV